MHAQTGIGIINPADLALDRELWQWAPESVTLHMTRLRHRRGPISVARAHELSDPRVVRGATRQLLSPGPLSVAYACSMASFINGAAGERALVDAMLAAGAPAATTSSGAMVSELIHHGFERVALLTPYTDPITERLRIFLAEHEIGVTTHVGLGLRGQIWTLDYQRIREAALRVDVTGADALFIACTNVRTYDLVDTLQADLGVPVLSANQVTIDAAVRLAGVQPRTARKLPDAESDPRVTLNVPLAEPPSNPRPSNDPLIEPTELSSVRLPLAEPL